MRILSFSHDGNLYGAQRSLLALLTELARRGHEVHLVVPHDGDLSRAAGPSGLTLHQLPYPYPSSRPGKAISFLARLLPASRAIRRLTRSVDPDLIHYNTAACFTPAYALRKSAVTRVWHLRERVPMMNLLARIIPAWSDLTLANCHDTAAAWHLISRKWEITVVHNGLDVQPADERAVAAIRAEFAGPENGPIALFAGQLREHKDPFAVIAAALAARAAGLACRFLLLGDGPLRAELEQAVRMSNLGNLVYLPGFRPDLRDYLAAADLVMIPSRVEPFPRIGLEAMAAGRCILASDAGGIPEQIVDAESGVLTPAGQHAAFAAAAVALLADPLRRQQLAGAAHERYAAHFTLAHYTDAFERAVGNVPSRQR